MPYFAYKARDPSGQIIRGSLAADNERGAIEAIRAQGYLVTFIRADRSISKMLAGQRKNRMAVKDLAIFARQFATMIGAGVPLLNGLRLLAEHASSKPMRRGLTSIADNVEAGETLASAFRKEGDSFPPIVINMVAAGEIGGTLDDVFERLAVHLEKEAAIASKVKSALVYPIAISVVAIGVIIFMLAYVLPQFETLYGGLGASLPGPTLFVMALSNIVRRFYMWVFLSGAVGALALRSWMQTDQGGMFVDRWLIKVPVFGELILKRSLTRFARTLGALLKSGVPILMAMEVVERTVGNRLVALAVRNAQTSLRFGQTLAGPLRDSKVFPPMVVEMVSVGEETGAVEMMLEKVADFYDRDIDAMVEKLTALIEPIIIAMLGSVVGGIVISMLMPIYNIYQLIE